MMDKQKMAWILLNSIEEMLPHIFYDLVCELGSAVAIMQADLAAPPLCKLSKGLRGQLAKVRRSAYQDAFFQHLFATGTRAVTRLDNGYPHALALIDNPPPVLYYRGKMPADWQRSVSIVGTRKASEYALKAAEKFGYDFSVGGAIVVSGLAWGVDAHSHIGALRGDAPVVGVLGCGTDVVYPPDHRRLFDQVIERGCIMSEYPPGARPLRHHFPARNRIISALTAATLFLEGARKSGAIITVNFALDQGKEVFVLPGSIFDARCQGNNALLRAGANILLDARDVAAHLGWTDFAPEAAKPPKPPLEEMQKSILHCLENGRDDLDQMSTAMQQPSEVLLYHLTLLELSGIIKQLPGNRWTIVPN